VPDTAAQIKVASDGVSIETQGVTFVPSPYDEFAVEMAIRLREAEGGSVQILSLGSDAVIESMRKAIAMGGDGGIHLKTDQPAPDAYTTAKAIADSIKDKGFDVLWLGWKAVDTDDAQTGQLIATMLGIPCVTFVTSVTKEGDKLICQREIDGGHQVVEVSTPCVITAQKGEFEPRYPKLMNIMKAKKKPVETIDITFDEPRVVIKEMTPPPPREAGKIVESAAELVRLLREEAKVL